MNLERLEAALGLARRTLLAEMQPAGYWEGHLSPSALSTATAISAMSVAAQLQDAERIGRACGWLADTQNDDGGWGDTPDSPSNLSTTMLCLAALTLAGGSDQALARADAYVTERARKSQAERVAAIKAIYGADRTFAVPILTNCALAGLAPWDDIPELPFELAAMPHGLHRALRLQVVSYALPALVAVGTLLHVKNPSRNPLRRALRNRLQARAEAAMASMQPSNGGFLEATPLTSFVAMSMAEVAGAEHPVVARCLQFIRASAREDGSWPIDTNLSVWVTTNAVAALDASGGVPNEVAERVRPWLLALQLQHEHPFTHAAPGGWAWTHLEGGVPDADDTSGALRALATLMADDSDGFLPVYMRGLKWLGQLQNSDGGWPTFCRGWGKLPFDQSCPDITAHALMAMRAHHGFAEPHISRLIDVNLARRVRGWWLYLNRTQRADGSWVPLWFGNQYAPEHENPVLGTARVLQALSEREPDSEMAQRGLAYLIGAQRADGGWGGAADVAPSVEETARAVVALGGWPDDDRAHEAMMRGARYLVGRVEDGSWTGPAPSGLYFASLWYSEQMYPMTWTVEDLGIALAQNLGGH